MLKNLLFALWFFAPAGVANAMPIFAAKMPGLKKWQTPLDLGRKWRGKRVFGANKTWRGLAVGVVAATFILALQQYAVLHTAWAQNLTDQVNYSELPLFILGPLFGLGALLGDAIESFFKRQRDVPPGHSWFPFDQLDYIIGGAIAAAPIIRLSVLQYVWVVVIWLLIHMVASYIGFQMKFKERPI